jgi:malate dehydrogenase
MSTIAILGAGALGGALAHKLAARGRVRSVYLIDPAPDVAAGKALDILQSGPVERFDTRVTADNQIDAVIGADAVVLTGPAESPDYDWAGEAGFKLLSRIADLTGHTPILCAGATQGALVADGVSRLGIDNHRLFGSAPSALVSALRALVAVEARVSPGNVTINLMGIPPARAVVLWSSATIGGYPLEDRLSPPQLSRLQDRVNQLWPTGAYTLASAAARIVEAIVNGGSQRTFTCFVGGDRGLVPHARSTGVTVGTGGIEEILTPRLSPLELVRLENALS